MEFSKELDEAMADEEFQKSLEEKTGEEVKAAYAERGIDIEKELSVDESDSESDELSESDLENVAGGVKLSLDFLAKAMKYVWKGGINAGIIARSYYDLKRYGNATRSYSAERIYQAARALGLE